MRDEGRGVRDYLKKSLLPLIPRPSSLIPVHGEAAAGTPTTIIFRLPFGKAPGKGAFVLFDPPNRSAIRIDLVESSLIPTGGGTWVFENIEGGTRMISRFTLRDDQRIMIPIWLFSVFARFDTQRSLRRLRRLVATLNE